MSQSKEKSSSKPPTLSFTAFVLSLSTTALQQLGARTSQTEDPCVNLTLARQTIDILEMLEKKTQGNLSEEESKLLANILYDLRMRFVQASRGAEC